MTDPTPDSFRALARSSPWLWRTLRFTIEWERPPPGEPAAVRAWVSRPHGLRVEGLDGRLITAGWWPAPDAGMPAVTAGPIDRPDGLVARRPDDWSGPYRYDDPMFTNYRWVAMLHPFELADGVDRDDDGAQDGLWSPDRTPIEFIESPRAVDRAGRVEWEATVVTTPSYAARCSCCPLLDGDQAARTLAGEGWVRTDVGRPRAWRVRLDRETGIVSHLAESGGRSRSGGWSLRIEAVDEPMPRALFGPDTGGGTTSVVRIDLTP